jgi:hypothetical protein
LLKGEEKRRHLVENNFTDQYLVEAKKELDDTVDQNVDQWQVGQMSVGQMSLGQTPVNQMSTGEMPTA